MNREIKFRFWKHGKMDYDFDGWSEDVSTNYHFQYCKEGHIPVMQFTGLKDKNGKDIYEGDIIKTTYPPQFYFNQITEVVETGVMEWEESGYILKDKAHGKNNRHHPSYSEVIGNIFQHPELLK